MGQKSISKYSPDWVQGFASWKMSSTARPVVDMAFKKPILPEKRKSENLHDPSRYYKSAKLNSDGDVKSQTRTTVEDDDSDNDDVEAGPMLPPDDEEEGYGEDDEEGRFFGSGLDPRTQEALDYIDEYEREHEFVENKYDAPWARKTALNFQKRITKNAEMRAKYETEPLKFMDSEVELDDAIRELSVLTEYPELYAEFTKAGGVQSLVGLLTHDNLDIVIEVVNVIKELTDEEAYNLHRNDWTIFLDAALEAELLSLLSSNLSRLSEDKESERNAVTQVISILEIIGSDRELSSRVSTEIPLLQWLLTRVQSADPSILLLQNKYDAASLLTTLVQTSAVNRKALIDLDAVDSFLQLLSPYRRTKSMKDREQMEYFDSLFSALTWIVDEPQGKTKFIEAEGLELMCIMLEKGKMARPRVLKLLDHAVGGAEGADVSVKLVEVQGLSILFGVFMDSEDKDVTRWKRKDDIDVYLHLMAIFASMFRLLPVGEPQRERLVNKFVEKDYEKVDKIFKLRRDCTAKLKKVDEKFERKKKTADPEDMEDLELDWLEKRLDVGLACMQSIDEVLVWLMAEDGVNEKVLALLKETGEGPADVKKTLEEHLQDITGDDEDSWVVKSSLEAMIGFLP
jgi:beta-catenin-like protein 1